jgi:hypothetical protein
MFEVFLVLIFQRAFAYRPRKKLTLKNLSMKQKVAMALTSLMIFSMSVLYAQNTVPPYNIRISNIDANGVQGIRLFEPDELEPNTVYIVRVQTASTGVYAIRATDIDGGLAGSWSNGFYVSYDPTVAADDGNELVFYIKTFDGDDFFTPMFMTVSEYTETGWINDRFVLFPQTTSGN